MSENTVVEKPAGKAAVTANAGKRHAGERQDSPSALHSKLVTDESDNRTLQEPIKNTDQSTSKTRHRLLNTPLQLSEHQEMVRIISNRLFLALFALLSITMIGGYLTWSGHVLSAGATNWMVILCGAIGGFISLQRRLKTLVHDDLLLLARSWVYVLLAPLVGGILALLLYFLFISGLLEGDLFPNFDTSRALDPDTGLVLSGVPNSNAQTGLNILFQVQGVGYKDYAKLVFWCFLAGYSESFVTNIISQFETSADHTNSNMS